MYPPDVFDITSKLGYSARGEKEITDVNQAYLNQGRLEYDIFEGIWADAGEHQWSLLEVGNDLARNWQKVVDLYPILGRMEPPSQGVLDQLRPIPE